MPRLSLIRKGGFTLLELLAAITIVLLMSAFTLAGLKSARGYRAAERAVAELRMGLELGRGLAMSEGRPVYLVIAGAAARPEAARRRAYCLIRDPGQPELLQHWRLLPRGVCFAPDGAGEGVDLLSEVPLIRLDGLFDTNPASAVSGGAWAALELSPDGGIRSGPDRELQPARLRIERGKWIRDAADNGFFVASTQEDPDGEIERVRLTVRPRTGVLVTGQVVE